MVCAALANRRSEHGRRCFGLSHTFAGRRCAAATTRAGHTSADSGRAAGDERVPVTRDIGQYGTGHRQAAPESCARDRQRWTFSDRRSRCFAAVTGARCARRSRSRVQTPGPKINGAYGG